MRGEGALHNGTLSHAGVLLMDRATVLTRKLLAFARQQSLQPQAVDLNEVVQGFTVFLSKVILFTSGYVENAGATYSQLPNSAYLQKPYGPTSLARAIRRILDAKPNE
jgi:hypothetical protein